jgi:hypothetical protein
MKLYAETPYLRTRQALLDAGFFIWTFVWVNIGMRLHDLVARLASPGKDIESAGSGFASNLDAISERVPGLPLIGDSLRTPFEAAAGAGRALESAGQTHQEVVMTLALWLGVLLAAIPILYLSIKYLPGRIAWIREAGAAASLRLDGDDLRLFAFRAIANRPFYELRRACPDPGKALATGDYAPLAELELNALGLDMRTVMRAREAP